LIFGRECLCAPHALALFIFAPHRRRRNMAGAIRVSRGSPTDMKNASCPAGVHMQSSRAGLADASLKKWGALAGMFTVEPAAAA
jgi:hypothetical protein